ncbi:transcriptional adapter 1 [Caerostris extrusa]|uniref:Transcriptional adapter 1 n=1 Tax=Caerostris extrusa TaxID=172846 RepID=A0AAV4NYV0_CAEEX|nr:transcriptional adapter 1 [Caerostris extrusa]
MAEANNSDYFLTCLLCNKEVSSQNELEKHIRVHNAPSATLMMELEMESEEMRRYYHNLRDMNKSCLGGKMKVLKCVLKENFPTYLEYFKDWIRCEITKFRFDKLIKPLFSQQTIVIHSEFLITFLREVKTMSKLLKPSQLNYVSQMETKAAEMSAKVEEEYNPYLIEKMKESVCDILNDFGEQPANSNDSLPDQETMYALSIITAWEKGLPVVNKKFVSIMHATVKRIIKNISKVISLRRRTIRVRADGSVYDILKDHGMNPEDQPKYSGSVTLPELLDALKAHPQLIPAKSMYSITIQAIIKSLENLIDKVQKKKEMIEKLLLYI